MAAVPIYIVGTITMKSPRGGAVDPSGIEQCVISGLASIEGLGIGGGPIIPPEKPPIDPGLKPEHPIFYPPYPAHPIVLPPGNGTPPVDPPIEPPSNPPSANWEWGWNPNTGWIPVYSPGDKPQPPPV